MDLTTMSDFCRPFLHVSQQEWNDPDWQLRHSFSDLDSVGEVLRLPDAFLRQVRETVRRFPLRVTPYYLSLARTRDPLTDPILRQCLPSPAEIRYAAPCADPDPLAETEAQPVPRIVRRYPDRALVLTTSLCAVHCRHCFRKRLWNHPLAPLGQSETAGIAAWLRNTPEVRDVLLSGGDPLLIPWKRLTDLLETVRSVPSVDWIRLATRAPVVWPQRLSREYCRRLARYAPLWCVTQFNHPLELTEEAAQACANLVESGIPVLNQTVLLRGVNDRVEVLETLFRGLVRMRVKPYYLFLGDLAEGAMHFRTSIERARRLHAALRGRLSGITMPVLAADLPEGGGKVVLEQSPEVETTNAGIRFRAFDQRIIELPDSPEA